MSIDYSKLKGKIVEICGTQAEFARRMGISEHTTSSKLNNKVPFDQKEIQRAIDVLGISACDIGIYFFDCKVQCNELD